MPGENSQVGAVTLLKLVVISCKHSCTHRKKQYIWKQAGGGSGWRRGAHRLALSRGQAGQLLAYTLMKDVSLSTQPCALLWTKVGKLLQCSVDTDISAVRVQDSRPSNQQNDRQTTWQWGRESGRRLVAAACARPCCWPQGLPMVAECLGLEADPCWLKWWCKFPAAKRAEPTNWWTSTPETQSHVSSQHLCQQREDRKEQKQSLQEIQRFCLF